MKIKVNHIEDKGIYHFNLSYGTYIINGERIVVDTYADREMTSSKLPVIKKENKSTHLTHYESTTGEVLSVQDYNNKVSTLCLDVDEQEFSTLELEYEYKKFIREYTRKYESTTTLEDVELEVQRVMLDTGSKYITSMFSVDSNQPLLCKFNRLGLQADTLRLWCSENNIPVDIPTHSGLKYVKINGNYVFTAERSGIAYDERFPVQTLTLEGALALEKAVREDIISVLKSTITPVSSLSDVMLSSVQEKLQGIISLAQQGKNKYLVDIVKETKALKELLKVKE
jgi:hypothetical protein